MKITIFIVLMLVIMMPVGWFAASGPEMLRLTPVIDEVSPLYMGVIPFIQADKLREQTQPVGDYLAFRIGRPVKLTTVPDYESLARLLELGKIHIAWFSHASLQKLQGRRDWQVICRPVQYDSVLYQGQIIVREDSPYQSVHDLRGHRCAYVDRFSGSGFYFPNLFFAAEGIRPLEFFSSVEFSQSHRSSLLGVMEGKYDAAAVFSSELVSEGSKGLRVIARTGPIPNDPLVVRADMAPELKAQIEKAMLTMHEDEKGLEYLKSLKVLRGTSKYVSEREVQALLSQSATSDQPAADR
jgi:phosphonate transport system substrate-binding protein